ncbi:MAG: methyl-accepting chemotaxis protein, partial [Defluviitaleaceae bacterium]|nr:methyl-accepting chemotaxis protein [Defluviitaleaceae bacterium]
MHAATRQLVHRIEDHRQGNLNLAFLREDLESYVLPHAQESINNLQALSVRYRELLNEQSDAVRFFQNNAELIIIVIALLTVILFGGLSYFITRTILTPIKRVSTAVSEVAAGKFDVNLTYGVNDELGKLTQDVTALKDVIENLTLDLKGINHEYNTLGNMDFRLDTSKYQNKFKDVAKSINNIMEEEVGNIKNIVSALTNIGDGNFNIEIDDLPGDFMMQPIALRAVTANLKSIRNEIRGMIEAAAIKGDLDFQIDESKYKGDWRELMNGLNEVAHAVDAPVVEIRDVMAKVSNGDFSMKVQGNYAGDFSMMKNAVNDTIDALSSYITEMQDVLAVIAEGDLTANINREYKGSFAGIRTSINHISQTLNRTMSEISNTATQVLHGANQISQSAMNLADGATTQAAAIQVLNESVSDINEQTQQNAENAQNANSISSHSTENAKDGSEAMGQTLQAMHDIKDASGDITQIIKVIQNIAFQTNLLALNASVEAARAGEHGKGFSVVAEEVRNLASRSSEAARSTTEMIEKSISRVGEG